MAALVEGQQYGLSAQDKINCNKSLVFVKLTDSALRSIEEYVKLKGDTLTKPTIEFQNSNGMENVVALSNITTGDDESTSNAIMQPSTSDRENRVEEARLNNHPMQAITSTLVDEVEQNVSTNSEGAITAANVITLPKNGSSQSYGFTLSNVEADGPQGSFECLRQTGHRSLESLGCMHMKMHIHANEDSYEKTRVKMAAAEQEHKKFCTKEIKPNGPHLGRKVKVKRPGLVVSPAKTPVTAPIVPQKTAFKPANVSPVKKQEQPKFVKQNPKNKFANCPELLRQPIRDRIIHILAVRPYKRPELIVRLINEGIREKDRKGITAILTQVGTLKGNVYTLANYLWNEVQENWKFGTQEELEIIRKRKQQFLQNTNSESEATSPNSQPNCSPVQKRVLPDPIPTGQEPRIKKMRISHYNRPDNTNQVTKNDSSEPSASDKTQSPNVASFRKSPYSPRQLNGSRCSQGESSQKSPAGMSYDNSPSQKSSTPTRGEDLLLSSSLNQRSSVSSEDSEKHIRNPISGLSQVSSAYTNHDKSPKEPLGSRNGKFDADESNRWHANQKNYVNSDLVEKIQNKPLSQPSSVDSGYDSKQVSPDSNSHYQSKETRNGSSKTVTNGYVNSNSINKPNSISNSSSFLNRSKVTSTTNGSCSNSPHSSSDSRDSMEYSSSDLQVPPPQESPSEYDCPDYVKEYGTIESEEQRAQYKADFNAEYEEYLRLHARIKFISRKFANLEHRLHMSEEGSEEYKKIKSKIYKEYRSYQHNYRYSDALKKFNFLHCKLSHIKRLVMEYDNVHFVQS